MHTATPLHNKYTTCAPLGPRPCLRSVCAPSMCQHRACSHALPAYEKSDTWTAAPCVGARRVASACGVDAACCQRAHVAPAPLQAAASQKWTLEFDDGRLEEKFTQGYTSFLQRAGGCPTLGAATHLESRLCHVAVQLSTRREAHATHREQCARLGKSAHGAGMQERGPARCTCCRGAVPASCR